MAPIDRIISMFVASGHGNESLALLGTSFMFWSDDELLRRASNDLISVLPPLSFKKGGNISPPTLLLTRLCRLAASSGDSRRRMGLTARLLGFACLDATMTTESLSALHLAVAYRNIDMVRVLLSRKDVNVNALTVPAGYSPAMIACKNGHADILRLLLTRHDIDLTAASTDPNPECASCTCLHYACGHDDQQSLDCVALLLGHAKAAATLNTPSARGVTPLYTACRVGAVDTIRALLAIPDINPLPATPPGSRVDICRAKYQQIVALLEQHVLAHAT